MLNIYVNTWRNYNNGGGGEWMHLPMSEENMRASLDGLAGRIGDKCPEWAVHGYEWTGADCGMMSEYENIAKFNARLLELSELDYSEQEEIFAAMEGFGYDLEEAMERQARGMFSLYDCETMREFAEQCVEDMGLPEFAMQYFDYEAYTRDLELDGYRETSRGVVYDTHGRV